MASKQVTLCAKRTGSARGRCYNRVSGKGELCWKHKPNAPTLYQRVIALEQVVCDLLAENAHQLVGGTEFARAAIKKLTPDPPKPEPTDA